MSNWNTVFFCSFILIQAIFTMYIGDVLRERAWRLGELESQVIELKEDIDALKGFNVC